MNNQSAHGDTPEEPSLINRLGDTISGLRVTVKNACEEILAQKGRVSDATDCLVQQYRVTAIQLIKKAEINYKQEEEDVKIIELMRRKMDQIFKEYEFFTLIAEALEREKEIAIYAEKVCRINSGKLPIPSKALFSLLSILGYNRKGKLEQQMQYQLTEILCLLECVIEDEHFHGLSTAEQEIYNLKWKRYVGKAREAGVVFTGPFTSKHVK